ncbi:MAG: uridine diphosphate-N-acetylglucosamine-binding protein YvcK [Erysipelotrichales bacterium]|nr:uridine diphosphate-N-acetylglucosamine-binding protein YvcK [Erysipelotrichales bacterium]
MKITVIGGGHGLSVILRGLKHWENADVRAIVTVADDGGSTGRLREKYKMPAMGDIRNVMLAMGEDESLFSTLMDYRFDGFDDVGGHNLGNLILTALTQITGNFNEAIASICKVLNVRGEIIPATNEIVTLYALMDDGVVVRGEHNIPEYHHYIKKVFYDHDVKANARAIEVIQDADIIIFGIGSLYTSIMPNLIIEELRQAICHSKAKKIYVCNAMSQSGETENFSVEQHIDALHQHLGQKSITHVLVNTQAIPEDILRKYEGEHSHAIVMSEEEHEYTVISKELLDLSAGNVRHDPQLIYQEIKNIAEVEE